MSGIVEGSHCLNFYTNGRSLKAGMSICQKGNIAEHVAWAECNI